MNKFSIIITLLLGTLGFSNANNPAQEDGYKIEFEVKGTKAGDTIQLAYYIGTHDQYGLEAKAYADPNGKGRFVFEGDTAIREGLYLVVIPEKGFFEIIINKDQFFSVKTDTKSFVNNMIVKGNIENEKYYEYLKSTLPIQQKIKPLSDSLTAHKDDSLTITEVKKWNKDIKKLGTQLNDKKANFSKENPDFFITEMLNLNGAYDIPEYLEITDTNDRKNARYYHYRDEILRRAGVYENSPTLRSPVFKQQVDKYFDQLIQVHDTLIAHTDKVIAMAGDDYDMFRFLVIHLTKRAEKTKYMCMEKYKWHMYNRYYLNDPRVDWLKPESIKKIERFEYMMRYNHCGFPAQELKMTDSIGVQHSLAGLDKQYTVVVFWSATCGHCKKTIPQLHEKYLELKDKYDLEVYSIHIDKETKKWKEFINKHHFEWLDVNDPNNKNHFRAKYNVYSTPTIYLLDAQKKIIAKRFDVELLEKILDDKEALKNK